MLNVTIETSAPIESESFLHLWWVEAYVWPAALSLYLAFVIPRIIDFTNMRLRAAQTLRTIFEELRVMEFNPEKQTVDMVEEVFSRNLNYQIDELTDHGHMFARNQLLQEKINLEGGAMMAVINGRGKDEYLFNDIKTFRAERDRATDYMFTHYKKSYDRIRGFRPNLLVYFFGSWAVRIDTILSAGINRGRGNDEPRVV